MLCCLCPIFMHEVQLFMSTKRKHTFDVKHKIIRTHVIVWKRWYYNQEHEYFYGNYIVLFITYVTINICCFNEYHKIETTTRSNDFFNKFTIISNCDKDKKKICKFIRKIRITHLSFSITKN